MIHKFKQGGMYFALDVNSGAIHVLDALSYELIDASLESDSQTLYAQLPDDLKNVYSVNDVEECFNEIKELSSDGQLNTDDRYLDDFTKFEKKPVVKAMCLHIAHDCNIRCQYCFASQGDFKGERSMMSLEVGKKALKYLCENSGSRKNLEVDFFGGEPLMNFEVVKSLVDYGRSLESEYNKRFRFTLTTNGVLLTDEIIDYANEHMENVVLSIDGRREVNDRMRYTISGGGTYDLIIPKFKKLVEKRGDKTYYVRGTFTKFNTDFAKDVIHMADLGFKLTSVEPVVTTPNMPYALSESDLETINGQYEALAEELLARQGTDKEFKFFHFLMDLNQGPCAIKRISGCGAGTEYLAVTPEGDLYPCHQFVGDERFKIGDVDHGVQNKELVSTFNQTHVYTKEACKSCWAKFYCSGGCHANAFNFNDSLLVPYSLGCEMEKKRIECSIYIHGKQMLKAENEGCV